MSPRTDALANALRAIAPAGVAVGARAITAADEAHLHPTEAAHVSRAVDKRRFEYATGRRLLRELLATDVTIPTAPDRKPVFPDDTVGSLAHDDTVAVAAVARADAFTALGIDVEPTLPLDEAMAAVILRPDETIDAHLAFTLKEAVYKAWSVTGGPMLGHHDVRLELGDQDPVSGAVSFRGEVVDADTILTGRYTQAEGRWLALVSVAGGRSR